MFHVNDTVLYGTDGVCTVSDITVCRFGKESKEYYVLTPCHQQRAAIYVPTDSAVLTAKMRPVLSYEDTREMLEGVAAQPLLPWNPDDLRRRDEFKAILQSGDRVRLLSMIKTIYLHGKAQKENGRKLHHSDEQFLKDAEALLYDEFSYVLGIPPEDVLAMLIEHAERSAS